MPYFSENLNNEQKNQPFNIVPDWLRLSYEKEILSYFIDDNIREFPVIQPLPIQKLCNEICIVLKLKKAISPSEPIRTKLDYISEAILKCKWYAFFDFVELVGELLTVSDDKACKELENLSENDDLFLEISHDVLIKLDKYSYQTYQAKLNILFLSHLPMYFLGDEGRIHSTDSIIEIENLLNKYGAASDQSPVDKATTELIFSTDIEWLIEQGKDLFDNSIRDSLTNGAKHVHDFQCKDALKIIGPTIEEICNKKIGELGGNSAEYKGLFKKAEFLESKGYLPQEVLKICGIIDSRNLVSHGYSLPTYILCPFCQIHFGIIRLMIGWFAGNKMMDLT